MSKIRTIALILKQRFPNLSTNDTIIIAEKIIDALENEQ